MKRREEMHNLEEILSDMCGHPVDKYDTSYIDEWESWYGGTVRRFHTYYQYNGQRRIKRHRYSMNMAKRVCEDWANLLINEKTDVNINSEGGQKDFDKLLKDIHFWAKANHAVEKSFALSVGALVVKLDRLLVDDEGKIIGEGKPNIVFINAKQIYPITYDEDGYVTECAFISYSGRRAFISCHYIGEDGNYRIASMECEVEKKLPGAEVALSMTKDSAIQTFDTGSDMPWFALLYPNIANNIDVDAKDHISIFANALDRLKTCDLIFDSLQNEFALGKKRIFVDVRKSFTNVKTGEQYSVFDPDDVAFYSLPESEEGNKPFFEDSTQNLRVTEHNAGIQEALDLLSDACGFGTKHYHYYAGSVNTATQVISENSDMFRNIKKHEIVIEDCLYVVFRALIYACNTFCGMNIKAGNIEIRFDDSIIEDRRTERETDRMDVQMQAMSLAEYRSKWYCEDEKVSEEKVNRIRDELLYDAEAHAAINKNTNGKDDAQDDE